MEDQDPEEIARESDTGTWDVPFDRVRAVKVSNQGLLSVLNPDDSHLKNKESVRGTNGMMDGDCQECLIVDCGRGCKRNKEAVENGVRKEETEPTAPSREDLGCEVVTESVKENGSGSIMNKEAEFNKLRGITSPVISNPFFSPVSGHLAKLNKKLAGGRGRSIRRAVTVEPGLPPSHNETDKKLAEETVAEQSGAVLESAAINEVTENKVRTYAPEFISDQDLLGKFTKRFAISKSFDCVNGKFVRITHIYSHNLVHVIEQEVMKDEYLDLLDEVNDIYLDESPLTQKPEIGDLVCAPSHDGIVHRAVIQCENPDGKFKVWFTDLGGNSDVSLKELKPFSDSLYQIPILGYTVRIYGLEDDLPLLSPQDFENNLKPWLMKQKLKITEGKNIGGMLHEAVFNGPNYSLADRIRRFQVWDWEKLFEKGTTNERAILEGKDWSNTKALTLPATLFPDHPVVMECSKILQDCKILFKNIRLDYLQKEKRVLQKQINRYVEKVKANAHFPTIGETFFFFPEDTYWRRATRLDIDSVYCFDTDETFSLKCKNETRQMCPEFMKVPPLTIMCMFSGVQNDSRLLDAIEKSFKIGHSYPIRVLGYEAKLDLYNISTESYLHLLS